mmetsp:Transcript_71682/g.156006  ORF Transcript_71682/g.156006 Transcript_71682/m.156006 type:complete len:221 (+) Transcript_71682:427-1089(+)
MHDMEGRLATVERRFTVDSYTAPPTHKSRQANVDRKKCSLPSVFDPANKADDLKVLTEISSIPIETIDRCFGETYVDWLTAKLLSVNLDVVTVQSRSVLLSIYSQAVDMIRRFSSTQPFADHLLALQLVLKRYQTLAGEADTSRLKSENFEYLPSLKDFAEHATQQEDRGTRWQAFNLPGQQQRVPLRSNRPAGRLCFFSRRQAQHAVQDQDALQGFRER